ncbi:Glutathione peroxidase-like 3 [Homarus americanus]|uniref:Glutathione peroxidase-like 3 n=1 Tax=Homarus americanus TaxID=6706 RepID=A0A8J5MUM8_HOMAM|nr:Glutathione peroxidase-like 3 [Homarus americanus]
MLWQEPAGNGQELLNGIKHVRPGGGFEPNFTIFKKINVNGEDEHPLYTYLKEYCPATRQSFADPDYLFYTPLKTNDIRWNWEKFLVSKNGKPYMRYDPGTKPKDLKNDIMFLLEQEE